jgi:thioredoxin-like negative regulator of GroEL
MKKELIYFGADWCGPCNMIKPQLQASGLSIRYVDIDASPQMASHYGIRNVPTIILVGNGELISRKVGTSITVEAVKQMLN